MHIFNLQMNRAGGGKWNFVNNVFCCEKLT